MPDIPAPTMATLNGLSGSTSSLCQRGARRSAVSAISSCIIGRYSSISQPAGQELEDLAQVGAGRHRRGDAAAVAEADQRLEGERADRRLLLGRQAALVLAHQQRVDAQVGAQQRQVARDVGQRRQQRRQVGDLERGTQLVVGGGDRLDRSGQCHGVSPRVSVAGAAPAVRRTSPRSMPRPSVRREVAAAPRHNVARAPSCRPARPLRTRCPGVDPDITVRIARSPVGGLDNPPA